MTEPKSCITCFHRVGWSKEFAKCSRTGYYCNTELKYGGKCVSGLELRLYHPRITIWMKVKDLFAKSGDKADNKLSPLENAVSLVKKEKL